MKIANLEVPIGFKLFHMYKFASVSHWAMHPPLFCPICGRLKNPLGIPPLGTIFGAPFNYASIFFFLPHHLSIFISIVSESFSRLNPSLHNEKRLLTCFTGRKIIPFILFTILQQAGRMNVFISMFYLKIWLIAVYVSGSIFYYLFIFKVVCYLSWIFPFVFIGLSLLIKHSRPRLVYPTIICFFCWELSDI